MDIRTIIEIITIIVGIIISVKELLSFYSPSILHRISLRRIIKEIDVLGEDLERKGKKVDCIVSFSGGGLIVADLIRIRHYRDTDLIAFDIDRYEDENGIYRAEVKNKWVDRDFFANKTILLVDDIVTSGRSMEIVRNYLIGELKIPHNKILPVAVARLKLLDEDKDFNIEFFFCRITCKRRLRLPWSMTPREWPGYEYFNR